MTAANRARRLFLLASLACLTAPAQALVDAAHLGAARAAFDSASSARELRCQFSALSPELNFSLRFQTGFSVKVPLGQFLGPGHGWEILLRVTPDASEPIFLTTSEKLPDVPETKIDGEFTGMFVVGQGGYQVDALLKDDARRVCKSTWRIEARPAASERSLHFALAPGTVAELAAKSAAPPAAREPKLARLTVLQHAASLVPGRAQLQPDDVLALTGSLGSLLDQLPARSVRVVIFSLDQGAVLFQKDDFSSDDLDRAAKTIGELKLALVDYKTLQHSTGPPNVAAGLLRAESTAPHAPDAIVFLGPYAPMPSGASATVLKPAPFDTPKLFYIQYRPFKPMPDGPYTWQPNLARGIPGPCTTRTPECEPPPDPRFPSTPGPDPISLVTKAAKGEIIEVTRPQDFAVAIRHIQRHVER